MKGRTAGLIGGGVFAVVTWFTAGEFASPDLEGSGNNMDSTFIYMLDSARTIAGIPFVINSGYRSEPHNRYVNGVLGSAHTKGHAADIKVTNSNERKIILESLQKVGFNRFGIGRTFIHVDNDPSKPADVIWLY